MLKMFVLNQIILLSFDVVNNVAKIDLICE